MQRNVCRDARVSRADPGITIEVAALGTASPFFPPDRSLISLCAWQPCGKLPRAGSWLLGGM